MEKGVSNRELASLIWLGVVMAFVFLQPSRRKVADSLGKVVAALTTAKLLMPLAMYAGWLGSWIWLAQKVGVWDSGLLKPTLLWTIFSGIGLYFSLTKALQQEAFFKSAILATMAVSAFVEFFIGFQSFPLFVELVGQPVVAMFGMIAIVAARNPGQQAVVKVANAVLGGSGLAATAWVAWNIVTRWGEIDGASVVKELLLPVWLTPIALVFVYVVALFAGYEQVFKRIDWKAKGRTTWRQKAALFSVAGVRLKQLRRLHGGIQMRVAAETTFKGARSVVAQQTSRDGLA